MDIAELTHVQGGVISRRQILENGFTDDDIARWWRRRALAPVHPGVYVDHTGAPTWEQRSMAAVLACWPAALSAESALTAHGLRNAGRRDVIRVAVDSSRRIGDPAGVRVRRLGRLDDLVQWNLTPPRLRVEDAVLIATIDQSTESGKVALLSDACQQRRTTAARLLDTLERHSRLPGRKFVADVLSDVALGVHSVLEHRYLVRVERPHGLPRGQRQGPFTGERSGFRDVVYEAQSLVVELDGRLGHEWAAERWADMARDVTGAGNGLMTVRAGWGQVDEPCRLAVAVGRLLELRGWTGRPRSCRSATCAAPLAS